MNQPKPRSPMLLCWGLTEESFHVKIKRDDAVDGCRLFLCFSEKRETRINQPRRINQCPPLRSLNLTIWSPSRTSFEMPTLKRKERYTASQWRSRSFQKSYKCGDLPNKIDSLLASLFQQEQPFVDASIQNEYHGQRLLRHKLVVCTK